MKRRIEVWTLLLLLGIAASAFCSTAASPTVSTNKSSYAKGETVYVSGGGLPPTSAFSITIIKSDGTYNAGSWSVSTDASGNFGPVATWAIPTNLASQDEGSYQVQMYVSEVPVTSEFEVLGFVVPEVPLGTLGAMAFLLAGLLLFAVKKRAVSLPRP